MNFLLFNSIGSYNSFISHSFIYNGISITPICQTQRLKGGKPSKSSKSSIILKLIKDFISSKTQTLVFNSPLTTFHLASSLAFSLAFATGTIRYPILGFFNLSMNPFLVVKRVVGMVTVQAPLETIMNTTRTRPSRQIQFNALNSFKTTLRAPFTHHLLLTTGLIVLTELFLDSHNFLTLFPILEHSFLWSFSFLSLQTVSFNGEMTLGLTIQESI